MIRDRVVVVLRRWATVVAYGVAAALAVFLAWSFIAPAAERLALRLALVPEPALFAVAGLFLAAVGWVYGRGRWLALLGLRHFLTHPPLYIAIPVAIGAIALADPTDDGPRQSVAAGLLALREVPPTSWVICFAVASAPLFFDLISRPDLRRQDDPGAAASGDVLTDPATLRKWIASDEEVRSPSQDLFRHRDVAKRIASRLRQSEAATIAVVGKLGSGKSTIKCLTMAELQGEPKIEIVDVTLWPYESAEAAVAGILHELIRAVGRHVGVLPVTGVPSQYADVIERSSPRWGVLGSLLRRSNSPAEVLTQLDEIALAIGVRFVLWIEDFERFAGGAVTESQQGATRDRGESERAGPVRALLHLLDRQPRISVLISDVSLRARFDVDKIARFVEHPPRLRGEMIQHILRTFRNDCLGRYAYRDPAPSADWHEFDVEYERLLFLSGLHVMEGLAPNPLQAIELLLQTPRSLKMVLRQVSESWGQLYGEIAFDDLFYASVLRIAEPDLVALVDDRLDAFRQGFAKADRRGREETHPAKEQLEAALSAIQDPRRQEAARALLGRLFPEAIPGFALSNRTALTNPQTVRADRFNDYWARFFAGTLREKEERDQALLVAIQEWRDGKKSGLVERLLDVRRSGHVEAFVYQFSKPELLQLIEDTCETLAPRSASGWADDHAPGIVALWRMCREMHPGALALSATLTKWIHRVGPTNLPLVNDLEYWFTGSGEKVSALLYGEEAEKIRSAVEEVLSRIAEAGSGQFARAINGGSGYTVYWSSWSLSGVKANRMDGVPFSGWPVVSAALLDLLRDDPPLGARVIAPFVSTANHQMVAEERTRAWVATFNEEQARRLFDFEGLTQLLSMVPLPEVTDQLTLQTAESIAAAKRLVGAEGKEE